MEELNELIKIVNRFTRKNLPLIDLKAHDAQDNKELNLFLGIKSGNYDSDEAASVGIYGEQEVDFKFRMLKSRLNKKLLNHLFFMDYNTVKLHKSATFHQECMELLHFSKLLLKIGEIKLATKLIYKTIDLAKECEFNDVLVSCLIELRDIYASTYRPKLFQTIVGQLDDYKALAEKEEKANNIYFQQKLFLNSSVNNRKKDLSPIKKGLKEISKIYVETQSFNVWEKHLKLSIWFYEYRGDFEDSLKTIESAEAAFENGQVNQARFNGESLKIARLYALLKLGRIKEGLELAEQYLNETEKEALHWYAIQENYFLLALQKRDYDLAIDINEQVFSNKSFEELPEGTREKWSLYRAYMYYLTDEKSLSKKIDYNAIVSVIPEFQKDKAGLNVATLILQVFKHIDSDLSTLHTIMSGIEEYVNKYLNNSFSKRTKLFCKLLNKVVAHHRDLDLIIQKSKYLTEKLQESEIEGDVYTDMEIIPYKHLWDIVVQRLSVLRFQSA